MEFTSTRRVLRSELTWTFGRHERLVVEATVAFMRGRVIECARRSLTWETGFERTRLSPAKSLGP